MNEDVLRWLQSGDDADFNRIYKTLRSRISVILKGDRLFRTNRFQNEDAEEWANDIIIILKRVRNRIEPQGFLAFVRTVVHNFLINRINERRDEEGRIPVRVELPDEFITDGNIQNEENQTSIHNSSNVQKQENETPFFNFLRNESSNSAYSFLIKHMLWTKQNISEHEIASLLLKTDLSRIAFTSLEPSSYSIYINPLSLLTRYDLWLNHNLNDRDYMWAAIDCMIHSKKEARDKHKPDPMVGAILADEHGKVIASSYRGENDPKGHCEYNLLEYGLKPEHVKRKYEVHSSLPGAGASVTELKLKNSTLYVTLEPCSDRNPGKCSCADRIIYSGIKKVFIGLKDPDKAIDGSGIKKLQEAGITVKYFHQDLLFEIIRAKNTKGEQQNLEFILSKKEFYLNEQPELFINNILQH